MILSWAYFSWSDLTVLEQFNNEDLQVIQSNENKL